MGNNKKSHPHHALPETQQETVTNTRFWLGGLITVLLGFVLASQLVIYLTPAASQLNIALAEQKLDILKNSDTHYNVIFLGSSRMYRGINPELVDAEANKLGCHIKSYNLGIPGLSSLEQHELIRRLESLQTSIDTIVIEPYSVPDRTLDQFSSEQRRYFYNWKHIADVARDHFSMPNVSGLKVIGRDILYLLYGFLYEQMGVGRLSQIFFPVPDPVTETPKFKPATGFQSTDDALDNSMLKRRENFLKRLPAFENKIKNFAKATALQNSSTIRRDLALRNINAIHDINKKAMVLIMPQIAFVAHAKALEQQLQTTADTTFTLMNLNKPALYRDLFNSDNWFDESHLNKLGSMALASIVAKKLCDNQGQEK